MFNKKLLVRDSSMGALSVHRDYLGSSPRAFLLYGGRMEYLAELEKAYLAGFFDGDGNVSIVTSHKPPYGYYHQISVIFTQSDKPFLDYWHNKLGVGSVYKTRGNKIIPSKKQGYAWRIPSRRGIELLRAIYPYLMIKKNQADIAFEFQDTIGNRSRITDDIREKREEIRLRLSNAKRLNMNMEKD